MRDYYYYYVSNGIHFHLKQNFQGNASFYSFNHETGNHEKHNLLRLIVIATETIKLI